MGKTLTRLATLATLSRSAGEGLQHIQLKPLSRTAGEGGPSAERWVGEGSSAFRWVIKLRNLGKSSRCRFAADTAKSDCCYNL